MKIMALIVLFLGFTSNGFADCVEDLKAWQKTENAKLYQFQDTKPESPTDPKMKVYKKTYEAMAKKHRIEFDKKLVRCKAAPVPKK